jgi:selenocysteine lyase/cysteine desulfurase
MDHNSVLRPLRALEDAGLATRTVVPCAADSGRLDPRELEAAIRPETGLVVVNHCSNITGILQGIEAVGAICRRHDVPFLVDAAQSLGHVPIDVEAIGCDMLAAPGHKGLLGPQGTGVLWIRPGFESRMRTMREGGTGSRSEDDRQPDELPDRFEPGCPNGLGIAGLDAALGWILERGVDSLRAHTERICERFVEGVAAMEHVTLHGPQAATGRTPVFTISVRGFDTPQDLADALERRHGLLTRPGFHCAPLAHRTLGTWEQGGGVRLSFGATSTLEECARAVAALADLAP